jgi:hypothetical protein
MKESKNADKVRLAGAVRANQDIDRPELQLLNERNALDTFAGNVVKRCGKRSAVGRSVKRL